jgi:Ca-activated chloride channel family protein
VKQIQNARSRGNTALRDAIATGLSRVSGGPGRFAMVLFSDGEDTFSRISQAELMRLVHSSAVTIYPIMFTGKSLNPDSAAQAKVLMRELAERTGGRIFAVTQAGDLPDIYRAIVEDLEGQYVLGFVSSDVRQDGAYRKLKVEVKRKDVRLRHREGYYAPVQ